ncbi:protein PAXX [Brachionichthys hirsutus]|uniref:protein PAXX n=1 Tax=Brachionichthys hirsutus TaxID=412623 RepID=UPI0036045165
MDEPASFCTVLDRSGQTKFVCSTRRADGKLRICLTDAAGVWRTDFTEDALDQCRRRLDVKSTEDYVLKLRSACGSGHVSVSVQDAGVEMHVGPPPGDLSVTLSRLEDPDATAELRELLFTMADRHGSSAPISPEKNQPSRLTAFEPRQQQRRRPPSATGKNRLAGTSLINPGMRRKARATGVAFDDAEED